jgi:hypothetical protein
MTSREHNAIHSLQLEFWVKNDEDAFIRSIAVYSLLFLKSES